MLFEEVLPELRKGGGARRSEWMDQAHIALGKVRTLGKVFIYFYPTQVDFEKHQGYPSEVLGAYRYYYLLTPDILATDWEIYTGAVRHIDKT